MRVINELTPEFLRETVSQVEDVGLRTLVEQALGHKSCISRLGDHHNDVLDGVNNVELVFISGKFYIISYFMVYADTDVIGVGYALTNEEEQKFEENSLDFPSELRDQEEKYILINE